MGRIDAYYSKTSVKFCLPSPVSSLLNLCSGRIRIIPHEKSGTKANKKASVAQ